MRSIGELARTSGLTVSALRFYDRSGVLTPSLVDPVNGYRWYTDAQVTPAQLVAGLRRVGMPLAEIAAVLRLRDDEPARAGRLLDAHLRRLENGLADARRELSRVRALIDPEESPMTTRIVLPPAALAAAVDAVRFAVGDDPELPVLAGVLLDVESDGVRLVATDRYRMALGRAAGRVDGPPVRALLPVPAVDEFRALLAATGASEACLTIAGERVDIAVGDAGAGAPVLPYEFADYRRLLHRPAGVPTRRIPVDTATLRAALRAGTPTVTREHEGVPLPVTVLGIDDRDGLRLVDATELAGPRRADLLVGVNGDFLLDALDAADGPQLVLELDGPITPLAVRRPDDEDTFSILMPIRL
ncbi:MerR family transcriptional regulator [Micromonospora sp. WMMD714]|uniref:DNA polymerase III subunit beta family protein n=1 Tax=Micromonospora sp. WMMD714 TaxID=3016097 RepID=UPI00249C7656|nr:MerR family transcriptional regulator [Micromonospora sp. WMMD714]WFE67682.1 MerR family transcriptional regulator [Micromonospora sp. WMMD714]